MSAGSAVSGLIADIGGTNARFALVGPGGETTAERVLKCADFPGPAEAAQVYLAETQPAALPRLAAFAVASPVIGDVVDMTNHVWRFSIEATRKRLGFERLEVVNDFIAIALAVPGLKRQECDKIGHGQPWTRYPIGVIGPGTGLGVALLIPHGDHFLPIATEGGHVTMPAADDLEAEVLGALRRRFGHVSAERVISGPGLVNLYQALAEVRGVEPRACGPEEITAAAGEEADPLARDTLDLFFAMLGCLAGNLALTTGAFGGIYLAGGILPQHVAELKASRFRARFEDKGRFKDYNGNIPTFLITHPYPAFPGLASLIQPPS